MYINSLTHPTLRREQLSEAAQWCSLISTDHGDAKRGQVGCLIISASHAQTLGPFRSRTGIVVLAGSPKITVEGDTRTGGIGTVLDVSPGASFEVRSGDEDSQFIVFSPGDPAGQVIHVGSQAIVGMVRIFRDVEVAMIAMHDPGTGFYDMGARILIDEGHGSSQLVLGRNWFAPEVGRHELHRHPLAEEAFFVVSGHGVVMSDEEQQTIGPGDVVFASLNDWHGQRNGVNIALEGYFGFLGVGSVTACGYELAPVV